MRTYGADRIVCGTDGTAFGVDWTAKALAEADIGDDAREKILHRNAAALLAPRAKVDPARGGRRVGGGARLRLGPRRPAEQRETHGFPP